MDHTNKSPEELLDEISALKQKIIDLEQNYLSLEKNLENTIREKELVLKEIHHRVKNNFQIVMSLLNLQENRITDPHVLSLYHDSENRIRAMALIHEKLYQSRDVERIDFDDYVRILITEIQRVQDRSVKKTRISFALENILLEMDQAIPCGLMINEIITNAFKYAFPAPEPDDEISVIMKLGPDNAVQIEIKDNGQGLPVRVDTSTPETLGMQLISLLGKNQLRGKIDVVSASGKGTAYFISFPLKTRNN